MVSVCLPSDALLQHLPSYLGFFYLGCGASPHGCSSKAQPLLLTLDEGYLLTAALPDLQRGIAPLGPPVPAQPPLLGLLLPLPALTLGVGGSSKVPPLASGSGWLLRVTAPGLWCKVACGFSWPPLISDSGCLLPAATGLRHRVAPPGRRPDLRHRVSPPGRGPWPQMQGSSSRPFLRRCGLAL